MTFILVPNGKWLTHGERKKQTLVLFRGEVIVR
jgi:hypothetical protein